MAASLVAIFALCPYFRKIIPEPFSHLETVLQ